MTERVIHGELVAFEEDFYGYTTYVFKNLDNAPFGFNYMIAVRWPNWDYRTLEIGEKGYLYVREVIAGEDCWYNGTTQVPYNFTNVVFIKFVKEPLDQNKDIII